MLGEERREGWGKGKHSHNGWLNAALRPAATRGRALLGEGAQGGHLLVRVLFSQKKS